MDIYIRKIENINNKRESEKLARDSLLKDVLSISYKDLSFNKFGKPYIKNSNIFFNISHSKGYIVLVKSNEDVGIDMETKREFKDDTLILLKNRIYNENDFLHDNFLHSWVIKEAYSKYIGKGISIGLKDIIIDFENGLVHHKGFTIASYKILEIYDILIVVVSKNDTTLNIIEGDL